VAGLPLTQRVCGITQYQVRAANIILVLGDRRLSHDLGLGLHDYVSAILSSTRWLLITLRWIFYGLNLLLLLVVDNPSIVVGELEELIICAHCRGSH
jgi:hypothetical protein